ncbi:putative hd domain-containing protein [Phaeomoniella chlamydospora]|uniref:Putative hd domain-containing protein n=1 Tax=Phaeomoniella chlamydospora TaxID=158046 RepID=A0A0G2ET35_PHACM|nr:putative hd domain-containing protein [Phaeomoniella chlamydospora]
MATFSTTKTSISTEVLIENVTKDVEVYFQNPRFDSSHDFVHVRRVLNLATTILACEQSLRSSAGIPSLDSSLVVLGALLHDVGDYKYQKTDSEVITARSILLEHGVSDDLAEKLQIIVDNVSYTHETRDPIAVAKLVEEIPELGIVQDADRLDAIGAVGVGRCFTFGGAKSRSMEDTFAHFDVKLTKLEGMMKTETGRKMAKERTERLKKFMDWWKDEWSVIDEP